MKTPLYLKVLHPGKSSVRASLPSPVYSENMEKSEHPADAAERSSSLDEKHDLRSDHDGEFVEGSEGVTHHELANLRQVADKLPWAAFLVVFVEFAER